MSLKSDTVCAPNGKGMRYSTCYAIPGLDGVDFLTDRYCLRPSINVGASYVLPAIMCQNEGKQASSKTSSLSSSSEDESSSLFAPVPEIRSTNIRTDTTTTTTTTGDNDTNDTDNTDDEYYIPLSGQALLCFVQKDSKIPFSS